MESFGIISTLHHRTGSRDNLRISGRGALPAGYCVIELFPFSLRKMVKRDPEETEQEKMEGWGREMLHGFCVMR